MKLLRVFGIGSGKILQKNCRVSATVTGVSISYVYVVKKPVRLYPNENSTLYSHYIHFTYFVDGAEYKGKLFVSLRNRYPRKGETFELYYDPEKPEHYATYPFPPAALPIGW